MSAYPEYVNGAPPVVTLKEYDVAPWAGTTCVDSRDGQYVIVVMQEPDKIVASISSEDNETLDKIFRSAHATHAQQQSK